MGRNDRLPVKAMGYMKLNYFRIYNGWGQIVFETKQLNDSGMATGRVIHKEWVLSWIAEGKDIYGNIIKDRGSFILIK
jgi:hypothetical protein